MTLQDSLLVQDVNNQICRMLHVRQIHGKYMVSQKTVFSILLDLALCVGACLNPLSRTPH